MTTDSSADDTQRKVCHQIFEKLETMKRRGSMSARRCKRMIHPLIPKVMLVLSLREGGANLVKCISSQHSHRYIDLGNEVKSDVCIYARSQAQ